MGINVFYVTSNLDNLEGQVGEMNEAYAGGEDFYDSESTDETGALWDWADLFKGEGGHLLSFDQAVAFPDEAAPWYIIHHLEDKWVCIGSNPEKNKGWRKTLTELIADDRHVVFVKARN